jgi:hypothetical protein
MTTVADLAVRAANSEASPLAGALNREWQARYVERRAPAPGAWAADPDLARFGSVAEVLAALEHAGAGGRDALLGALSRRAAGGDRDAARVVLQSLVPYLVGRLRVRRARPAGTFEDTVDDLLSAAWQAIAEGAGLGAASPRVALLRRAEQRALGHPGRLARRRAARELPVDPDARALGAADLAGRPTHGDPCPADEVVALLAEAAGAGLAPSDVRMLGVLAFGGPSAEFDAEAEGVTPRCIRWRRARAVRRLAELAA